MECSSPCGMFPIVSWNQINTPIPPIPCYSVSQSNYYKLLSNEKARKNNRTKVKRCKREDRGVGALDQNSQKII